MRLILLKDMVSLPIRKYLKEVLARVVFVTIIATLIPGLMIINMNESIVRLFMVVFISFVCSFSSIYMLGINSGERKWVNNKAKTIYCRLLSRDKR